MMRKIKLVVSDFHLGFGRAAADGTPNALEDFISDDAFIDLMEYYRTGEYVDAEVELILNGDIFECLAIDPESPDAPMITARKSVDKVRRIVDGHQDLFQAVRIFAESERRQVLIVVGNHDQDLLWEEVQRYLQERIHPRLRFITGQYRFDGVLIEHGHQHEKQNRIDEKKMFLTRGFAEPILNLPWGSDFFITCLMRYKQLRPYVTRVRPFRLALSWSFVHDFWVTLLAFWYFLVAVIKARFRKERQRRFTILQTLRIAFDFTAWPTLENAAKRLLQEDGLHTVIFGHTHIPLWRHPIAGKSYINSGSWIPTSNLHIAGLGRSLLQTYVYLEYEGGLPRARLKRWHGRHIVEEDVLL
jgi:UDP-2,3-diacylglucosamine pyrophosphatase LpxH